MYAIKEKNNLLFFGEYKVLEIVFITESLKGGGGASIYVCNNFTRLLTYLMQVGTTCLFRTGFTYLFA